MLEKATYADSQITVQIWPNTVSVAICGNGGGQIASCTHLDWERFIAEVKTGKYDLPPLTAEKKK